MLQATSCCAAGLGCVLAVFSQVAACQSPVRQPSRLTALKHSSTMLKQHMSPLHPTQPQAVWPCILYSLLQRPPTCLNPSSQLLLLMSPPASRASILSQALWGTLPAATASPARRWSLKDTSTVSACSCGSWRGDAAAEPPCGYVSEGGSRISGGMGTPHVHWASEEARCGAWCVEPTACALQEPHAHWLHMHDRHHACKHSHSMISTMVPTSNNMLP